MSNQIYLKTTNFGNSNDDCLILDGKTSYKQQFPFGDDWTKIHVGAFISYTRSLTDPNLSPRLGDLDSTGTSTDTFSYLGISKYAAPDNFLPRQGVQTASPDEAFSGFKFKSCRDSPATLGKALSDGWWIQSRFDSEATTGNTLTTIPIYDWTNATGGMAGTAYFAFYVGFNINKASTVISIGGTGSSSSPTNGFSNVSAEILEEQIDIHTNDNYSLNMGVDDFSIGMPDSFFFYNGLQSARMRIHAMGVKKII